MSYTAYIKFYGLKANEQTHEDWLFSEWSHGRAYQYNGKFYSTLTGEELN